MDVVVPDDEEDDVEEDEEDEEDDVEEDEEEEEDDVEDEVGGTGSSGTMDTAADVLFTDEKMSTRVTTIAHTAKATHSPIIHQLVFFPADGWLAAETKDSVSSVSITAPFCSTVGEDRFMIPKGLWIQVFCFLFLFTCFDKIFFFRSLQEHARMNRWCGVCAEEEFERRGVRPKAGGVGEGGGQT